MKLPPLAENSVAKSSVIRDDFFLETADWGNDHDRAALCALREEVFVREQNVPPELEIDQDDPRSLHVLARAAGGAAIGTCRLAPQGRIGRMAVLADWRGSGVGTAMLHLLLEQARSRGLREVQLSAQTDATGFYLKHGFEVSGEDFMDAGIPHRPMRRQLDTLAGPPRPPPRPRPPARVLSVQTREQLIEATLTILRDTRRELRILVEELDPVLLDDSACLVELRRIAISGRGASIRVIAQSVERAEREGNRMLELAQRLPSVIRFRRPLEDIDRDYPSAFMCTDVGGYLFRPIAQRMESIGSTCAPGRAAQLEALFDQVWERSEPMGELRPLDI
ncbi:MAG TPA: GNAT family N-acetyltransferase [Rhodanobacteraceae bacterium]|nr:GNAT family N-acetyltransferase [Rhodanobacteraceae bacterium]